MYSFFFFFFKQKTAFEVRIRDWSSDVCSSDLSRGVNTSFDKVREWLAGLEKCDIQESEAIGALLSALEGRAVNAGLVRTAAVLRTAMLEIDRETAILIDAAGPREAANDRSEEHTSELQSLMRISYAVFCLKKKKHKKN